MGGGLGEKGEGIKQKQNKTNPQRHKQYGNFQRKKRVGEAEEGNGGINSDGRRLDLGWRTHTTIYT